MTRKDWDLLPAPKPWISDDGATYRITVGFGGFFYAFAIGIFLLLWSDPALVLFSFLPGSAFVLLGSLLILKHWKQATDGMEDWVFQLPMDYELYDKVEASLEPALAERGYRLTMFFSDIAVTDRKTGLPMGRKLVVHTVPGARTAGQSLDPAGARLAVDYHIITAGKAQIPFFNVKVRYVTERNYGEALLLQRDVLDILGGLDRRVMMQIVMFGKR